MKLLSKILIATALAVFTLQPHDSASAQESLDVTRIRQLLIQTFDKPDDRLLVDPIVVEGDVAIVSWAQADMGGRALLRRKSENWVITLCSGDALKNAETLEQVGVAPAQAKALADRVVREEAKLAPDRVALFSRFDGLMIMDENQPHPPGETHHGNHH